MRLRRDDDQNPVTIQSYKPSGQEDGIKNCYFEQGRAVERISRRSQLRSKYQCIISQATSESISA